MAKLRNAIPTDTKGQPAVVLTWEEAERLAKRLEQEVHMAKSMFTNEVPLDTEGVMLAFADWPFTVNINC